MADKAPEDGKKSKLTGILAIIGILIIVVALVIYFLPSAAKFGNSSTPTTKADTATTTEKKPAPPKDTPETDSDIGPYKGWQKYNNKDSGVTVRYPVGWTISETPGTMAAVFIGPPTPGGAILNECTFAVSAESISSSVGLQEYVTAARLAPLGGGDITSQIDTSVDSNEAIEIVDTYVDAGFPWRRMRVWTNKNDKAYTFTYAASPNYNKADYYSAHIEDSQLILDSILIK